MACKSRLRCVAGMAPITHPRDPIDPQLDLAVTTCASPTHSDPLCAASLAPAEDEITRATNSLCAGGAAGRATGVMPHTVTPTTRAARWSRPRSARPTVVMTPGLRAAPHGTRPNLSDMGHSAKGFDGELLPMSFPAAELQHLLQIQCPPPLSPVQLPLCDMVKSLVCNPEFDGNAPEGVATIMEIEDDGIPDFVVTYLSSALAL